MTFNSDRYCRNCEHLFHLRHLDDTRDVCTADEDAARRCNDCVDCNPPEDAPIKERAGDMEGAPA